MKVALPENVLGLPLLLALPARAAEPPKAVPPFECIGLYQKGALGESGLKAAQVHSC
jgi:hypothetical protein